MHGTRRQRELNNKLFFLVSNVILRCLYLHHCNILPRRPLVTAEIQLFPKFSSVFFFYRVAFAAGIHTGERQNDKRWEGVYFKARSRSHNGGSPCLLKLAGLLAAKSQWFGCVGRSKVMFKISKCSLFRVRLQHRLCDLWFYKPSSQLGWFELSPLLSSPPRPISKPSLLIFRVISFCLSALLERLQN